MGTRLTMAGVSIRDHRLLGDAPSGVRGGMVHYWRPDREDEDIDVYVHRAYPHRLSGTCPAARFT